jgi:hypothetical protein
MRSAGYAVDLRVVKRQVRQGAKYAKKDKDARSI